MSCFNPDQQFVCFLASFKKKVARSRRSAIEGVPELDSYQWNYYFLILDIKILLKIIIY